MFSPFKSSCIGIIFNLTKCSINKSKEATDQILILYLSRLNIFLLKYCNFKL